MREFTIILYLVLSLGSKVFGQVTVVMGRVVDTDSSDPIGGINIRVQASIFTTKTNDLGAFAMTSNDLPLGDQVLIVEKQGYVSQQIQISIQEGGVVNLDPILLQLDLSEMEAQIGIISLSDNELNQDEGTVFNISGLLQASNDIFLNAAAFDFSATFFRPRGLDNANGKVLINGIEMNKQFNGRPQWGNWGGLNDAQRNREFSMGLKANEYTFGDAAGTTNIIMRASKYRQGGRVSYASANRSYRGRIMASYNSGVDLNGWSYAVLASRRYGDEGYQKGTVYDSNSFFASLEKKLNVSHSLNLTAFYTPNRRGRSTAITQEVRDLKGIQYNPNWGYQDGEIRNSRIREVKEPVIMLNHYWNISLNTSLNTNIGYQFGKISNTRIDNGGTRLIATPDGQEAYIGGARNPSPNYYQRLPSFFLQNESPSAFDYQNAFLAQQEFVNDGQLDWNLLYRANAITREEGGNSIYALQDDRVDDKQLSFNSIIRSKINDHISLNGTLSYRSLKSENYAQIRDLLGGVGYLDVDFFAEDDVNTIASDLAQSDLKNRNRIVAEGDRYKYNYEIYADVISAFGQGQFKYNHVDFYAALLVGNTKYSRNGLYENGNFPGERSLGESEDLSFTNFGLKLGGTYKVTGRHLIDFNAGLLSKAPGIRNSFSNARQNNDVVIGIEEEKVRSVDLSYIYRSPIVKSRLTAYVVDIKDQSDLGFYFTENISGLGVKQNAFVQEVMTGIETRRAGAEFGIEAQLTPTIKVKGAASMGQYIFTNNPNLYLTSDDFDEVVTFGDGTAKLKDYHLAGGPETAAQLGFEYRDPDFWWIGITGNYFSHAYIDVNNLARTSNFTSDFDGQPFNDYDTDEARDLLAQEQFDDYFLVNIIGGKSWRINSYFVGFFATVNNVLDQGFVTGGFEQGRLTNFRDIKQDKSKSNGQIFGPRYFFGSGTTYYLNMYVRF